MLTYSEVKNLTWATPDLSAISMDVTFDALGVLPFCAVPDDVEEHGRELFERAAAGDFGPIADYVAPPPACITQFSVLDFRDRFTVAEKLAIRAAQMTDMEVGLVYDEFQAAQFIDVDDPRVAGGIDLYITKGLLEPNRKAELLAPQAA